jgi:hypothetical protein
MRIQMQLGHLWSSYKSEQIGFPKIAPPNQQINLKTNKFSPCLVWFPWCVNFVQYLQRRLRHVNTILHQAIEFTSDGEKTTK